MKVVQLATTLLPTERGNGAYVSIDDKTREALGGGGRIPVRATFNGAEYRGTICKIGGVFCLGVNRDVRAAARTNPGDSVNVTLERDVVVRTIEAPNDLRTALFKSRPAREFFESQSFTHRKKYVRWIESAKKPQTRMARVAKAVEMLRVGTRTPDGSRAAK